MQSAKEKYISEVQWPLGVSAKTWVTGFVTALVPMTYKEKPAGTVICSMSYIEIGEFLPICWFG